MAVAIWVGCLAVLAFAYYFFFGPGPTPSEALQVSWYTPRGWAVRSAMLAGLRGLAENEAGAARLVPVLLFAVPPLALLIAGFRITKNAAARVAGTALATTAIAFVYYGYLADGVWRFFSWRWPAVTLGMAAIVAAAAFAPSLLRSALALPTGARAVAIAIPFFVTYLLATEITGTNPELTANLSPWPLLTLFGLLLVARLLGAIHLGIGAGELLAGGRRGVVGVVLGLGVAAIVAFAAAFGFDGGGAALPVLAAIVAVLSGLVLRMRSRAAPVASGAVRAVAGLLVILMVGLSNWRANEYQRSARDETSAGVIEGLDAFHAKHGGYPDDLADLVPEFLPEVPRPHMGLISNQDEVYTYSNFGDSYALEFSSVLWVQCAYSPPYAGDSAAEGADEASEELMPDVAAEDEGATEAEGAGGGAGVYDDDASAGELAGSWSCDQSPPKLW